MAKLPREVLAFHKAMKRLVAVTGVATGLKDLSQYPASTWSLPGEFGDLPHALLRRTKGGRKFEAWANTEFELTKDKAGWLTLEFLAWWVRDLSRSGEQIQLRPMALPPVSGRVQLGSTLKFIIDHLIICPEGEVAAALEVLQQRADSLNTSIDDYADTLGSLVAKKPGKKS